MAVNKCVTVCSLKNLGLPLCFDGTCINKRVRKSYNKSLILRTKKQKFLNAIKEIDINAYNYLVRLEQDKEEHGKVGYNDGSFRLQSMMCWSQTPQGHFYWHNICSRLPLEFM